MKINLCLLIDNGPVISYEEGEWAIKWQIYWVRNLLCPSPKTVKTFHYSPFKGLKLCAPPI